MNAYKATDRLDQDQVRPERLLLALISSAPPSLAASILQLCYHICPEYRLKSSSTTARSRIEERATDLVDLTNLMTG